MFVKIDEIVTRTDIDEYWENAPLNIYKHYIKLKSFGRNERDIEWNIRNRILEIRKIRKLYANI